MKTWARSRGRGAGAGKLCLSERAVCVILWTVQGYPTDDPASKVCSPVSPMSCQARQLCTGMRGLCGETKTFLSFQRVDLRVVGSEALTYVTACVDSRVFRACL